MNIFSAKILLSTLATALIVSGLVYAAATINSVATQTINSGDNIGPGWYQNVNDYIKAGSTNSAITTMTLYSCPQKTSCDDGQAAQGAWASYGCVGQIASSTTCHIHWWNNGPGSCSNACTKIQ